PKGGLIVHVVFPAEDGIRDPLVTGVQTCALPILGRELRPTWSGELASRLRHGFESPGSGRLPKSLRGPRSPRSLLRSPRSLLRSPRSLLRSPPSLLRSPRSLLRSSRRFSRSPRSLARAFAPAAHCLFP